MKKQEEKKQKVSPSEQALHYLYILSMDCRKMKQNLEADKAYLLPFIPFHQEKEPSAFCNFFSFST